jgi:DHA1 family bicyclomycin/chloramphenicol resistance-like MFS transporter
MSFPLQSKTHAEAPKAPGWYLLAVLSLLMGFASISTDLYLPAMPAMSRSLHADTGLIEWTISGYLIGFSFGQLLWGPLGDRYGRRRSVAEGLVLFVIGSAGCALSQSVSMMISWRLVQALGACASVALARAMVRDLYEGNRAAQMLSTLMTVMAIAPLVGPLAGGQILTLAGWRAIFWTLVGIGTLTFLVLFTIPETLPVVRRNRESLVHAMLHYGEFLGYRRLLGYAGAGGFLFAGTFAYVAGTPFVYITYYHVRPELYGLLFGLGTIGVMVANLLNSWLVPRFGYNRMLLVGTIIAAGASLGTALAASTGQGGLWGLVVPLFVFVATCGLIIANSITGALADFPERAGAVSALIGAVQYGGGIIGSGLVGALANGTPRPMGWIIALSGIGSLLSVWLLLPKRMRI